MLEGSASPVTHLVYSDGLASVSVFIETNPAEADQIKGLAKVGSAFTFSTTTRGHQVTAVGEVPSQTVQLMAHSTQPDAQSDPTSPNPAVFATAGGTGLRAQALSGHRLEPSRDA